MYIMESIYTVCMYTEQKQTNTLVSVKNERNTSITIGHNKFFDQVGKCEQKLKFF
jgi:hypothetical protein